MKDPHRPGYYTPSGLEFGPKIGGRQPRRLMMRAPSSGGATARILERYAGETHARDDAEMIRAA